MSYGLAAHLQGRWKEATETLDRADRFFRENCTGAAWELDTIHTFSLWSMTYMGHLAELGRRLPVLLRQARERGDWYAVTNLSTYISTMVWLAQDDLDAATRHLRQAIDSWSHDGFHVQHHISVLGELYILLYSGDGRAAWEALSTKWPSYSRSLLLHVQHVRIDMYQMRARIALSAASSSPSPRRFLLSAEADARRLESERVPWADAHARSIRALVAAFRGDRSTAAQLLLEATALFDAVDMGLHAAVMRHRLGRLLSEEPARASHAEALQWMGSQEIRNPGRMADMIALRHWGTTWRVTPQNRISRGWLGSSRSLAGAAPRRAEWRDVLAWRGVAPAPSGLRDEPQAALVFSVTTHRPLEGAERAVDDNQEIGSRRNVASCGDFGGVCSPAPPLARQESFFVHGQCVTCHRVVYWAEW